MFYKFLFDTHRSLLTYFAYLSGAGQNDRICQGIPLFAAPPHALQLRESTRALYPIKTGLYEHYTLSKEAYILAKESYIWAK